MTACKESGVKVEFKQLKMGFTVVFHRFNKEVDYLGRVVTDKVTDKKSREKTVIEYLNENEFITNKIACELLSISDITAKRLLKSMVEKEYIIAEGERKSRVYKIKK